MSTQEILTAEDQSIKSFLSFRLEREFFAVEVKKVIEILEVPSITKVPKAPKYMSGIINLRGKVLPVIDTRIKFGLSATEFTVNTCIVVIEITVEGEVLQIGTLVDAVMEVMDIENESIQPSPSIEAKYKLDFIHGMFHKDDHFIMILNLDAVFSVDEAIQLHGLENSIENN